jgi:gliding motility-associated-like protein
MIKKFTPFVLIFLLFGYHSIAQVFYNNGAVVSAKPGVFIQVNGAAQNASAGTITVEESAGISAEMIITDDFINDATAGGGGIYRVAGDWLNNNTFNANTGSVYLNGVLQIVGGSVSTSFYNLILEGTGNKTQAINQTVTNTLNLNDRELLTETFTMFVTNAAPNAIQRTTGFVSSLGTGVLSRATNSTSTYLFPVGSSVGTSRYRPVEIAPTSAAANIYTVRLANVDATTEGYDRSLMPVEICNLNPLFYHRINRTAGTSAINLSIYYDAAADGNWDGIANWTTTPLWQIVTGSSTAPGVPFHVATANNWNTFNQTPYILYMENITVDLGPDVDICQGSSTTLDAGAGFDTYLWNPSGSTQTINVSTGGTYTVTVTQGICSNTDDIVVNILALPSIDLGPDTALCAGDNTTLDAGAGFTSYQWSTFETTQTINVNSAGTYSVTISDGTCQNSDAITVSVQASYDATITSGIEFCSNAGNQNFTAIDGGGVWSGTGVSAGGVFDPSSAGAGVHEIIYTISGSCGDADTVNVTVYAAPIVDLGLDFDLCDGSSATLDAGAGYSNYAWLPSGSSQTINVTSGGTYSVTVTDANNCQGTDNITVTIITQQDATIITTGPFCSNDSPVQFNAQDPGGVWSGTGISGSGLFNPSGAGAGTHTITYGISGACGDTATVSITVNAAPVVDLGADTTLCSGETLVLDAGPGSTWQWSPSGSTQTINVTTGGTYSVTVTDGNTCQGTDAITVIVLDQQDASILTDGPFCSNDSPVQFQSEDGGGSWSGTGISGTGLFNPSTAGPGTHTVTYTIAGSCGDSDSQNIIVYEAPLVSITHNDESCIGAGDGDAIVVITGGTSPYIISWNTGGDSDSLTGLTPGIYDVLVTDQNGCSNSSDVTILGGTDDCTPPHVFVPNIFSPNGDGENDILFVRGEGIQYLEFIIYNRWGEKLFETTTKNVGWDGTYNGKRCDSGVFVYHINVTFTNGTTYDNKGNITLVY